MVTIVFQEFAFVLSLVYPSGSVTGIEFAFKVLAVSGDAEAKHPETERHKDIPLHSHVLPGGVRNRRLNGAENIEQPDNQHQRCVLEQRDKRVNDARNNELERLGQDDQSRFLPVPKAQRTGGFVLSTGNGLQAIPRGQYEAASALGLGYWKKTGLIILPQALKLVIPGIVNTFISLFKDTTLVLIIGLFDILGTVQSTVTDPAWQNVAVEGYVFVAFCFWVFCFGISRYSQNLERKLDTGHRT